MSDHRFSRVPRLGRERDFRPSERRSSPPSSTAGHELESVGESSAGLLSTQDCQSIPIAAQTGNWSTLFDDFRPNPSDSGSCHFPLSQPSSSATASASASTASASANNTASVKSDDGGIWLKACETLDSRDAPSAASVESNRPGWHKASPRLESRKQTEPAHDYSNYLRTTAHVEAHDASRASKQEDRAQATTGTVREDQTVSSLGSFARESDPTWLKEVAQITADFRKRSEAIPSLGLSGRIVCPVPERGRIAGQSPTIASIQSAISAGPSRRDNKDNIVARKPSSTTSTVSAGTSCQAAAAPEPSPTPFTIAAAASRQAHKQPAVARETSSTPFTDSAATSQKAGKQPAVARKTSSTINSSSASTAASKRAAQESSLRTDQSSGTVIRHTVPASLSAPSITSSAAGKFSPIPQERIRALTAGAGVRFESTTASPNPPIGPLNSAKHATEPSGSIALPDFRHLHALMSGSLDFNVLENGAICFVRPRAPHLAHVNDYGDDESDHSVYSITSTTTDEKQILVTMAKIRGEVRTLFEHDAMLHQEASKLQMEIARLNAEVCRLKSTRKRADSGIASDSDRSVKNVQELEQELSELRVRHDQECKKTYALENEICTLREKHEATQREHLSLENELKAFKASLAAKNNSNTSTERTHQLLRAENDSLRRRHEKLSNDHKILEHAHQQIIINHDSLQRAHEKLAADYEDLERAHHLTTVEHESLQRAHERLASMHETLKRTHQQQAGDYKALERTYEERIASSAVVERAYDKLIAERDDIAERVAALKVDHADLEKSHSDMERENKTLREQIAGTKKGQSALHDGLAALAEVRDSLHKENMILREQVTETQKGQAALLDDLAAMRRQQASLESENAALRLENANLKKAALQPEAAVTNKTTDVARQASSTSRATAATTTKSTTTKSTTTRTTSKTATTTTAAMTSRTTTSRSGARVTGARESTKHHVAVHRPAPLTRETYDSDDEPTIHPRMPADKNVAILFAQLSEEVQEAAKVLEDITRERAQVDPAVNKRRGDALARAHDKASMHFENKRMQVYRLRDTYSGLEQYGLVTDDDTFNVTVNSLGGI